MDIDKIRGDFPILRKNIIYFDNAATTLTPKQVLDSVYNYYTNYRANIYRGIYKLSLRASKEYDKAREKVASFIKCKPEELIFNRNTSEGINQVALSLKFEKGDRVITTAIEHHSNLLPWMKLRDKGVEIDFVFPDKEGKLNPRDFKERINDKTKIVAVTHISNVLGIKNPVERIGKICKKEGILFIVDGAQSAPHIPINVKKIGCDFFAFSGHKMLAPTGIGALYMKYDLVNELNPACIGGGTIKDVSLSEYSLMDSVVKWESGTPNISGAIGFGRAVDYINSIGMKNIERYEGKLTKMLLKELSNIDNVIIYGTKDYKDKIGIITFNIEGINAHEVAKILDERNNICVRSGYHCTMPLFKNVIKANESVRVSLYLYNTIDEIDTFLSVIRTLA